MSSEAISFRPFIPSTSPPPTIMVGMEDISHIFSRAVQQYSSSTPVEKDPIVEIEEDGHFFPFVRDRGVVGLNHIYFIPYPIHFNKLTEAEFKAHLPMSSSHFLNNPNNGGLGRGFYLKYVKKMDDYMRQHHLPHYGMLSTIEGGNCYVFFDSQGNPKAIVGLHSLALTLIGLERQEYFKNPEIQDILRCDDHSPDEEDIRHARNMRLFVRLKDCYERISLLNKNNSDMTQEQFKLRKSALKNEYKTLLNEYQDLLLEPVSAEDRMICHDEARIWKAKEVLARQVIAHDLGIPIENIAFVTQRDFHIDMDMFVDPNGEKVYLDERASNPSILGALDKIDCQVILVQGVHTVGNESINFMNGVFVSTPHGPLFVTNGVKNNEESIRVRNIFFETFKKINAKFQIHFLEETREILTVSQGGIHCLTWERLEFATPLDIVLSYLDENIPEQKMRRSAGEAVASLDTPLGMGKAVISRRREAYKCILV